jgi:hypothetical protein
MCHNQTFGLCRVRIRLPSPVTSEQAMPRYFPIDAGVSFDCARSDLLAINWTTDNLSADFILPGVLGRALRVRFNGETIVRLLDEMPLSTEQGTRNEGLVSRHFAYRVEGSTFAETQSEAWKLGYHPVCQYEFSPDRVAWMFFPNMSQLLRLSISANEHPPWVRRRHERVDDQLKPRIIQLRVKKLVMP